MASVGFPTLWKDAVPCSFLGKQHFPIIYGWWELWLLTMLTAGSAFHSQTLYHPGSRSTYDGILIGSTLPSQLFHSPKSLVSLTGSLCQLWKICSGLTGFGYEFDSGFKEIRHPQCRDQGNSIEYQ